ncbi:MAG: hypothetical protein OEX02_21570 [Cyclobacteriaceae bacterium]|nr:hypothetical protein [Cyclobacteriaceae bacterium]
MYLRKSLVTMMILGLISACGRGEPTSEEILLAYESAWGKDDDLNLFTIRNKGCSAYGDDGNWECYFEYVRYDSYWGNSMVKKSIILMPHKNGGWTYAK